MNAFSRPQIVVSKCLGFAECRWNGLTIPDEFIKRLAPFVDYHTTCPEVEIGLGVPREPIRIVMMDGEPRLMQPATGADVTDKMRVFSQTYLDALPAIDGFILKGRSPSCGIKDVKQYRGMEKGSPSLGKGMGIFGDEVTQRFDNLAIEEEGRLKNFAIREHFLTRVFTSAKFRTVKAKGTMGALVNFHSDMKYLLMAYNESQLRKMGPIVANHDKLPPQDVFAAYEMCLQQAFQHLPRRTAGINVLMHVLGYFSEKLTSQEKAFFLDTLQRYREKMVPLSVPVSLLYAWIVRFDEKYLARQDFFSPYPAELVAISDSGKGRDLR